MTDAITLDVTVQAHLRKVAMLCRSGDFAGARAAAAQILATNMSNPSINGYLGMLWCQMGDLVAGIDHLRTALLANPRDSATRANLITALAQSDQADEALQMCSAEIAERDHSLRLWRLRGFLLHNSGDFAGAILAYKRVLAGAPDDFESWNNLGNVLAEAGDAAGGIEALERAAELRPDLDLIRRNLGTALIEAGRGDEAALVFDACARDFPHDPKPLAELGIILGRLHRGSEALEAIKRAVALAPNDPDLQVILGERQAVMWALDLAEEAFHAALAIDPSHSGAHIQLAILLDHTNRAHELSGLAVAAEQRGVSIGAVQFIRALACRRERRFAEGLAAIRAVPEEIEQVRRAQLLGEFHDRLDHPAEAFAAYAEMNRLQAIDLTNPSIRSAEFREGLRREQAIVTPEWYAGWRREAAPQYAGASSQSSPVFLVGFPRSGTTLLDTMLMGHSRVKVLEERPPLRRVELSIGGLEALQCMSGADERLFRTQYFKEVEEFSSVGSDDVLVDKFPLHLNKVPLIHRLFPDARFILALRHPCDVVLSCFITSFRMNNAMANFLDLHTAAETYDLTFSYWKRCTEIMPIQVKTIKYEHLIDNSEAELRSLFNYLDLEWQEGALNHHHTAVARGTITTASYSQVTEPIYRRASGRWERYRAQMDKVLPILKPWAERMGYAI